MKIQLKKGEAIVLRTCHSNGTSRNSFLWPKKGPVKAPDWIRDKQCGHGLHGALNGIGYGGLFYQQSDSLWQIVKIKTNNLCKIGPDKVKFPSGVVLFTGTQKQATEIMVKNGYVFSIGATSISSNKHQPAISTDLGKSVCKTDCSTAISGNLGSCIVKNNSSVVVKNDSMVIAGDSCRIIAGDNCEIVAGRLCKIVCGYNCMVKAFSGTVIITGDNLYGYVDYSNDPVYSSSLGVRLDVDTYYRTKSTEFKKDK